MTAMHLNEPRPSLLWEQRAGLELTELIASPMYAGIGVPRGDGSPVLVLPGFLGSDRYLSTMRGWLRRVGYQPHTSGFRFVVGPPLDLLAQVLRRAETVAEHAGRPPTVIGHSLGGLLGSLLVRLRPDLVAHLVTLGSPLRDPRRAAHPLMAALGSLLVAGGIIPAARAAERRLEQEILGAPLPAEVQLTCIYTREDPVVRWQACIDPDPRTRAYEVTGTHAGLAWNAQVYRLLGHVLLRAGREPERYATAA